jgi:endoglucanase
MIPEGLEWASADEILSDIAGIGFNYIRMCVSYPDEFTAII